MSSTTAAEAQQGSASSKAYGSEQIQVIMSVTMLLFDLIQKKHDSYNRQSLNLLFKVSHSAYE